MVLKRCFRCNIEFTCSGNTFDKITMAETGKHCWEVGSCECPDCASIEIKGYYKDFYLKLCIACFGKERVKEILAVDEL